MDSRRVRATAPSDLPRHWLDDVPAGGAHAATWRLRVRMADRPGTLARVAIRLADLECNILGLAVLPVPGGVLDEIVIRPATGLSRAQLVRAVEEEDCECLGVTDADVRELVDSSAAGLAAAGRVVADPDALADAVRDVLAADLVTVVPSAEANPARTEGGHRATFATGEGQVLVARRLWAPFLRQELARAEALLGLLAAVEANVSGPTIATCADGATVVLREARPADARALSALHGRCSTRTLFRRYGIEERTVPRPQLHRLLVPPRGISVVAVCGRDVVALGRLIPEPGGEVVDAAEVSVLVEDAWQRNGLGTAMLRRLAVLAAARGHRELVARCSAENDEIRRTALRAGLSPAPDPGEQGVLRIGLRP
ncbi:GNAT family N-acetyltransferase [Prauserella cavernicola]|uniref:GNAT family N-acetyltransferase n=1 Tax=Prauserella cavernicola TaxID=2800127 RepID=A0A934QV27_9PSEU|nr:GNAT family N-acetyltransferase [Prauserella cavernicola]MBK1786154.1 GNAT family N-acetyltransferase [Prauserella cavernicola]